MEHAELKTEPGEVLVQASPGEGGFDSQSDAVDSERGKAGLLQ